MIESNSEPKPLTLDMLTKAFDEIPKDPNLFKTVLVPKSLYDKSGFKELAKELGYKIADD